MFPVLVFLGLAIFVLFKTSGGEGEQRGVFAVVLVPVWLFLFVIFLSEL